MIMTIGMINPLFIDELTVLISAVIMESFNADEQAVIGTFLETLGSMIPSHSVYILYNQGLLEQRDNSDNQDDSDNQLDILEKSIDKIKEELDKHIKQDN